MGHRLLARRLPAGSWPRPRLPAVSADMNLERIAGIAHRPEGPASGVVVLTHGAGGNRESALLQQVCDEWARRGWIAVRYNLPYRRRRPTGPRLARPPPTAPGSSRRSRCA